MAARKIKFKTDHVDYGRVAVMFDECECMTEQHHKMECDINNIVDKFDRRGVIEHRNEHRGTYGFATSNDFQEAMYVVAEAQSMFNELPSHIRNKFENDPAKFLDFVQEPKNAGQMVELGLATSVDDIPSKVPQIKPEDLRSALADALNPPDPKEDK